MSVQKVAIDRLTAQYGSPKTDHLKIFIAEWIRAFHKADMAMLSEALSRVIDRNTFHAWPTIGEVKRELVEVAEERHHSNARLALPAPVERQPTAEERARVAKLMKDFRSTMAAQQLDLGPSQPQARRFIR
jgi:hypothetical protein